MSKAKHKLRIAFLDIECTNLRADYGYVICVCWKEYGKKKIHTASILNCPKKGEPFNDINVLKAVQQCIDQYDCIVTWYGARFDIPYLNARMLYHGLEPIDMNIPHIDLWKTARNHLKLSSNRLANVQNFLQLENEKTALKGAEWIKAQYGNKRAIGYVIDHCKADVLVLEQAYEKLRPLIRQHPNVNLVTSTLDACPTCGEEGRMKKNGIRYMKTGERQRYKCKACGASAVGPSRQTKGVKIR